MTTSWGVEMTMPWRDEHPTLERRVPGDVRLEGPWQELLCLAQLWLLGTSGQDLVVQVLLQPELGFPAL